MSDFYQDDDEQLWSNEQEIDEALKQMQDSMDEICDSFVNGVVEFKKGCECGADKCKTTHSSWCPKYKM